MDQYLGSGSAEFNVQLHKLTTTLTLWVFVYNSYIFCNDFNDTRPTCSSGFPSAGAITYRPLRAWLSSSWISSQDEHGNSSETYVAHFQQIIEHISKISVKFAVLRSAPCLLLYMVKLGAVYTNGRAN